jgi:hypothetical protein
MRNPTSNHSFDHSNHSFDDPHNLLRDQEDPKGYMKSNTLGEGAPYRIERTKFGIEICDLQETEDFRRASTGDVPLIKDGNL